VIGQIEVSSWNLHAGGWGKTGRTPDIWWRCLWNMSWALCYYTRPFGHRVIGIVKWKTWNVQQLCAGAVRNFMLTELNLAILMLQYNEMFVYRTVLLLPN